MPAHVEAVEQLNQRAQAFGQDLQQTLAWIDSLAKLPGARASDLENLRSPLSDVGQKYADLQGTAGGLALQTRELNERMQKGEIQAATVEDQWGQLQPLLDEIRTSLDGYEQMIADTKKQVQALTGGQ
jgi:chromosome segregation ATPase